MLQEETAELSKNGKLACEMYICLVDQFNELPDKNLLVRWEFDRTFSCPVDEDDLKPFHVFEIYINFCYTISGFMF